MALLCIIVLTGSYLSAQDFAKSDRIPLPAEVEQFRFWGAMGMTAGLAFPLNDLGSTDVFQEESGYASRGYSINPVNVHYRFWKYYSFGVNWTRVSLPYNIDAKARELTANISGQEISGSIQDRWQIDNISAGIVASMPTDFFDLDVKVMVAAVRSRVPENELFVTQQGGASYTITQRESRSLDLGYSLALAARVHVYRGLEWFLQAEYFSARPRFQLDFDYSLGFTRENSIRLPVHVLSLNTGLGLRF